MITLLVAAACLLVLGLLFGKRFGILVLALAAGLVLDQYVGATVVTLLAPYAAKYVSYIPPGLVILPALVLLMLAKGRHRRILARGINALVFAFAGLVFLIAAPNTPMSLSGNFPLLTHNLGLFIAGLIGLAVIEITFGKVARKKLADGEKK